MKKVLILLSILVIPSVAYLILHTGKTNFKTPEIFGPKEPIIKTINGKQIVDTIYHIVDGFQLLNQDSILTSDTVLNNKFAVVDFFFSSCQTICPQMTAKLTQVQNEFKDKSDLVLLSFSVDSDNDKPSILKNYAEQNKAIDGKWYFLTGDKRQIFNLASSSYFLTAQETSDTTISFIHSEKLILLDKQHRIRGFYDGTDFTETKKLIEDLKFCIKPKKEIKN